MSRKNRITWLLFLFTIGFILNFLYSMEEKEPTPPIAHAHAPAAIQVPDDDPHLPSYQVSAGRERAKAAENRVKEALTTELTKQGLHWGDPIFIRALKEEKQLEIFIKHRKTRKFILFRRYQTAAQSGKLGPKIREGDGQVPEGFYFATQASMRPYSNFHLAINCGYPNSYDQSHQRTGSYIMIHGARASIGCLAMTDFLIEEIYTLSAAAFAGGQKLIRIHFFPFHMTPERLKREESNPWHPFWTNLKEGYDWFQTHQIPPDASVHDRRYIFRKSDAHE